MSIDNKKLAKEFATIFASTNKAKQLAVAELGKIDEKYRKLAEKEKESLNETVKMLDTQLNYYGNLLGLNAGETPVQEEVAEEPEVVGNLEVKEDEIVDTIFPENNEEEVKNETEVVEAPVEAAGTDPVRPDDAPAADKYADIWPDGGDQSADEKPAEVKNREFPNPENVTIGEDGWPEWPEQ